MRREGREGRKEEFREVEWKDKEIRENVENCQRR